MVPQDVSLQIVGPGGLVAAVLAGDGMEHQLVEFPHLLHVQRELLGRLLVADHEKYFIFYFENILILTHLVATA